MKKIEILKKTVSTVVGIGTAKIIREVIANNVDTETVTSKVTVSAAAAAIGGAVSEMTKQYTDKTIDEIVGLVRKIKNRKDTETTEE